MDYDKMSHIGIIFVNQDEFEYAHMTDLKKLSVTDLQYCFGFKTYLDLPKPVTRAKSMACTLYIPKNE